MAKTLKGKVAFGIFVDGLELKFAHLSLKGKRIFIRELKTLKLHKKLDEHEKRIAGFEESQELFTEASATGGPLLLQQDRSDTNSAVLLNLLSQYPPKRYMLTYSIAEPSLYYQLLEGSLWSKDGAVKKKKLLEELRSIRTETPDPDAVAVIPSSEKGVLCVVREDGLKLIDLLEEIKPYLGKRLPRIPFIDAADVSLMNLVRLECNPQAEEITTIVYVGVEFSRIIFMKGEKHLHFAPLITEGADSPNLDNRLYSRILLEQDNLAIPRVHRIVLTGYADRIGLREFLRARFPSVEVDYLSFNSLEKTDLEQQLPEVCSEYAIPIATAWRALQPKNRKFSPTNLLPSSLIERQKFFKLSWHGYLIMVLLFLSTFYFTWQSLKLGLEVRAKTAMLSQKQHQLAANLNTKAAIEELMKKIELRKGAIAVYDSLVPGSDQWTNLLTRTTNRVRELGSIWITNITSTPEGGIVMSGYALYRNRIPRLAAFYERAILRHIAEKLIRDRRVYEFEIYVPNIRTMKPSDNSVQ